MKLLPQCICGTSEAHGTFQRNDLQLIGCACGTVRLDTDISSSEYEGQYFGDYHASSSRHPGCRPYKSRYRHDKKIARIRWQQYQEVAAANSIQIFSALDVGASNGAFADQLAKYGIRAIGIDPDPSMFGGRVFTGNARQIMIRSSLVTYHDVLEHLIDPQAELDHVAAHLLDPGGMLVIDVPDVSVPEGEHHFKAEHLWYFTASSLAAMLRKAGLKPISTAYPIPGKLVIYSRRQGATQHE